MLLMIYNIDKKTNDVIHMLKTLKILLLTTTFAGIICAALCINDTENIICTDTDYDYSVEPLDDSPGFDRKPN